MDLRRLRQEIETTKLVRAGTIKLVIGMQMDQLRINPRLLTAR